MSGPRLTWVVLTGCALLIVGATGWLTQRILGMEAERNKADAQAELEERVRLSLSRMDAAASALLIVENQRPPAHFQAFYAPDDILTNAYQNVGKSLVLRPSPLLEQPAEFVRLHFERRAGQDLRSPQVPVGNQRDLAEAAGISQAFLDRAVGDLESLKVLLGEECALPTTGNDDGVQTNFEMLSVLCAASELNGPAWNDLEPETVAEKSAWVAGQRKQGGNLLRQQADYQEDLNYVEQGRRAQVLEEVQVKAAQDAVAKRDWSAKDVSVQREAGVSPGDAAEGQEATPDPEVPAGEATPFRPVWLGEQLFAVRRVVDENGPRLQGLWLDAGALERKLLESCSDLLPAAGLVPVRTVPSESLQGLFDSGLTTLRFEPRALVTLPWKLEIGEAVVVSPLAWTPLRVSLVVGWAAVVLALLAAAFLVRGVIKMSERRAAFVSSVTHELRTPLTTFQLYSDLLAGGMVQDEGKRQGYLDTLCLEAGRLNHLIENVLAYSRIERGSARTKHEVLPVCDLVERFRRRVQERVEQEEGTLEWSCDQRSREVKVDTDVTAVEQIIFNLVDNACKYGMGEGGGTIALKAEVRERKARLAVCDEGGGIDHNDLKKLFRPFHKSAKDAANSKPGVGLGLALSRRLARALGGDLKVEANDGRGACFVLELPVQ